VKRPRSLKQFTLTTARAPVIISETAAMNTPQTATDQKIAGAGSKAVIFNQRPVIRPNLE